MASKFLNLSTDTTLGGNAPSDEIVSSQKALKTYIDNNAGGGGLPSQTGNSGKFLTTDGTDASWNNLEVSSDGVFFRAKRTNNKATMALQSSYGSGYGIIQFETGIGTVTNNWATQARFNFKYDNSGGYPNRYASFFCGGNSVDVKYLGQSSDKWDNVYTTKINNGSNIAVPTTGGTMVVADITGATAGQVLTLNNNLKPVWSAGGGGSSYTAGTGIDITSDVISVDLTAGDGIGVSGATISLGNIDCGVMVTPQQNTLTFSVADFSMSGLQTLTVNGTSYPLSSFTPTGDIGGFELELAFNSGTPVSWSASTISGMEAIPSSGSLTLNSDTTISILIIDN